MEEKKLNKGLVAVIILLLVVIVMLGCVVGYILLNNNNISNTNDTKIEDNENSKESVASKIDISKEWVYDADYYLPTNKESYGGYTDHSKLIRASELVVPYINIDSSEAKKTNKEIYKLYEDLIDSFNANSDEGIFFTIVEYKTYYNDNIISIVIKTETAGTFIPEYNYYIYNFNLKNGKLLSYNEAYEFVGLSKDSINDKVIQGIYKRAKEMYSSDTEANICKNISINNYEKTVKNNDIKFFIDENKKIYVVGYLENPNWEPSGQDEIIIVE